MKKASPEAGAVNARLAAAANPSSIAIVASSLIIFLWYQLLQDQGTRARCCPKWRFASAMGTKFTPPTVWAAYKDSIQLMTQCAPDPRKITMHLRSHLSCLGEGTSTDDKRQPYEKPKYHKLPPLHGLLLRGGAPPFWDDSLYTASRSPTVVLPTLSISPWRQFDCRLGDTFLKITTRRRFWLVPQARLARYTASCKLIPSLTVLC